MFVRNVAVRLDLQCMPDPQADIGHQVGSSDGNQIGRTHVSKQWRFLTIGAGVAGLLVLAEPTFGAECIGVTVPDSTKVAGADLVLNGLGIRKATLLKVKVYVAGLYLPQKSNDPGHILSSATPWQLSLHFVRDVDESDMRDAFDEGFEKAAGDKGQALKERIETLKSELVDFKEGHNLSFTNDPVKGVIVDVNGAVGKEIQGTDFAEALLSIWIGNDPPNGEIKTGLLGGKCE